VTTTDDGSCGRCVLCARADPVSNRLRNIEATEKAKRDMMEARKAELAARRRPEDVDYSAARCKWIGAGVFFPQSSSPLPIQPCPRFLFSLSRFQSDPPLLPFLLRGAAACRFAMSCGTSATQLDLRRVGTSERLTARWDSKLGTMLTSSSPPAAPAHRIRYLRDGRYPARRRGSPSTVPAPESRARAGDRRGGLRPVQEEVSETTTTMSGCSLFLG
jgi:hypothetical protein